MLPRYPPRPSQIKYSLMEERYFDATRGNIKQMAQNPDTFWPRAKPMSGLAPYNTRSRASQSSDTAIEKIEENFKKRMIQKESIEKADEPITEVIKLNSASRKFPLNIRMLQYFSYRHPKLFNKAIKKMDNWDFDETTTPRDMLLIKRSQRNEYINNEELQILIELQKKKHNPNDKEMNLLKVLSTQLIYESYEQVAVMLKGCGRSLMVLQDAEKVNTYMMHPGQKKLFRCMHRMYGPRICILEPNSKNELDKKTHEAIDITKSGLLPAYVARIKRPALQLRWWKNHNFPCGVGDLILPSNTSCLCLPFVKGTCTLGIFELLRFEAIPEFREIEKCLAEELIGLTQTAISLSIENSQIKKEIASHMTNDLFQLQYHFLGHKCSVDDIMRQIPIMVQDILQVEICYVVIFRDDKMFVYLKKDQNLKILSCPIVRFGLFYTTALEGKLSNTQVTWEKMKTHGNAFILNEVKDSLSKKSYRKNRINFLMQPVIVEEKMNNKHFSASRESMVHPYYEPICIREVNTESELMEQQVLCLITAINKKNWNNQFNHDDEILMESVARTLSSILQVSKYYCEIQRNIQLLDLAMEVTEYQTTPTDEEIELLCDNFMRNKDMAIPDFKNPNLYKFEPRKRLLLVSHFLYQVLQMFSFPLEKIVNYTLSITKRITKENPWHNTEHWFLVSHTACVWVNTFCQRFTDWERISFFLAANMTSVGHRGLTNDGLKKLCRPLIKLFPESPIQNLAFEMCNGLIVGPHALFNNLTSEKSVQLLKNIKQIFLTGDSDQFLRRKPFYTTLMKIMDWSNEAHRIAILEIFLYLSKREFILRDSQGMLKYFISNIMVEYTNEGIELMENGFEVPDVFNAKRWWMWPELWIKTMEELPLFAARILASIIPETEILYKVILGNHDFIIDNIREVKKKIEKSLHLYPQMTEPSQLKKNSGKSTFTTNSLNINKDRKRWSF